MSVTKSQEVDVSHTYSMYLLEDEYTAQPKMLFRKTLSCN